METVIQTAGIPATERLDYWRSMVSETVAPVQVSCDEPADFRVDMRISRLGPVQLATSTISSCETLRTPKLIRQSAPDALHLTLVRRGHNVVNQDGRERVQKPAELMLHHTSHPFRALTCAEGGSAAGYLAVLPRSALPLSARQMERLTVTPIGTGSGVGALLANFITSVAADIDSYRASDAPRLGNALIDLLVALLTGLIEDESSFLPETRQHALLLRIHAFIQENLSDPELCPATVAAAHHISTRSLHRLFQAQDATITEWIRGRRLDRCRRDLTDPLLRDRPVHAVASKWGFRDPAHFTRVFRGAYGVSPTDYRDVARN